MPTTVVERWGSLSATGIAKEAVFGTAVLPTSFVPMTGNTLDLDPGLFWPKVMMGQRDLNIFPLYGQWKVAGSVTAPLFGTNGAAILNAAIGADAAAGSGVTGSTPTSATTLSAASLAGATTVQVTSATGYSVGSIIQVDVNASGPTTTAECRKVTTVATNTLTLDQALTYAHASGAAVAVVAAPYTHTISQANMLPSLTVEKDLGGYDSLQLAGCRVNKFEVSIQASNQEVGISADLMGKSAAVLDSPSPISVIDESPFVFPEVTVSYLGQTVAQATGITLTMENGVKDTYTLNQSHYVQFLTPITRAISAKLDLVFTSLDDPTWGYYTQMINETAGDLSVQIAHPGTAGSVSFDMPKSLIKTYTDAIKQDDVIMSSLALDIGLNLATSKTIGATVVDSQYLPF